ncbi:MAG: GLPGLI family protein [Ferruginibacter sp.]
MKKYISLLLWIVIFTKVNAQQFISKAEIEFEVKTNIKKTLGNNRWDEMLKDNLPQFKTGYYNFSFANNKSIYKFDHWDQVKIPDFLRRDDESNVWYFDHDINKFQMQKTIFGAVFNVEDSIQQIKWSLSNENRIIAGFNCRKAVGKIRDSVYIFAFYTDEIMIPGGPCSINGLPGMILGLTIPRMYQSFIATKVMVTKVNENAIKAFTVKKPFTIASMQDILKERTKDRTRGDDEDSKKWVQQMYWNALL